MWLGVASEASLWRADDGNLEPVLSLGDLAESRRARATARDALRRGSSLRLLGGRTLRSALVRRFSAPCAAVVARVSEPVAQADAYLQATAVALSSIYERELLLERSAERERLLVRAGEQRLMRIGFDLHDGPIQDVLALGAEVSLLRDQVYPFILDSHRERAAGRFDDIMARVTELDRQLRELSRSLESRSIITRPLGEILHREVDAFQERTGIETRLEIRGDPESLTSAQRIAVYRAIQESLSNVREHSGAADRRDPPADAPRLHRGPCHGRRARLRGRPCPGSRGAARAPRDRRHRRAGPDAGRHVRDRQRSGWPDDAHLRPPARHAGRALGLPLSEGVWLKPDTRLSAA